jgi:hypothetical protein
LLSLTSAGFKKFAELLPFFAMATKNAHFLLHLSTKKNRRHQTDNFCAGLQVQVLFDKKKGLPSCGLVPKIPKNYSEKCKKALKNA